MIALGIDIGGSSIKGAIVNSSGKKSEAFIAPILASGSSTILSLIPILNRLILTAKKLDEFAGVGIGVPGTISRDDGICIYSNNLKWKNLAIVSLLKREIHEKIVIENDANAAALGEAKFGKGKEFDNFIILTLGTGIGSGVILKRKLFKGGDNLGVELGHIIIKNNGKKCTCGNKGCLEAYVGGYSLINEIKRVLRFHSESKMWEGIQGDLSLVTPKLVFTYAKIGDECAKQILTRYISYLGDGIISIISSFRPEAIIFAGGIAKENEYLLGLLMRDLTRKHYGFAGDILPKPKILISSFLNELGIYGAASLVLG